MILRMKAICEGREMSTQSPSVRLLTVLGVILSLFGCVHGGPDRIDPGTSYPAATVTTRSTHHYMANLIVYTERYLDPNVGDSDAGTRSVYTGYTVYDDQGRKVSYARQDGQEPNELSLAPGKYLVMLDRPAGHAPGFWVKVEQGRITEVRLDGVPLATAKS